MDATRAQQLVNELWDSSIVPTLHDYIRIPNQSPGFDPQWQSNGHMDAAVELMCNWIRSQNIAGLQLEVIREPGRTPLILMELAGQGGDTVLLYGHLDKQPPMDGWEDGLGPWTPVLRDGKLYGRGGADDGYAAFATIAALKVLQEQKLPHARLVIVIEACEESGSGDLPHYLAKLSERIGTPSLVVCLDSGCGNYEQLWVTSSLRGLLNGTLSVRMLRDGVHSGAASGIVPSTFRIARQLIDRLEDGATGTLRVPELYTEIPAERLEQASKTAVVMADDVRGSFPFVDGARPVTEDVRELLLNRTWRPQLEVVGAAGLPTLEHAGNVLRPQTTLKLSVRIPPQVDPRAAATALKKILESEPPYGATVHFECSECASGWSAPPTAPWLQQAIEQASSDFFGRPPCFMGEGGTIPFMAMLGRQFPEAQFLITGVLGPRSNAHGPNEFLHIGMAKGLSASVARVLVAHVTRRNER